MVSLSWGMGLGGWWLDALILYGPVELQSLLMDGVLARMRRHGARRGCPVRFFWLESGPGHALVMLAGAGTPFMRQQ